jgi:Arc/MetJ-type ribon-helix-helix transcriptional regulator
MGGQEAMSAVAKKQNVSNKVTTDKARVQFDFSKESLDKLDEIVKSVDASTRAEVIRRALTLFTEILAAESRGAKVLFREKDGTLIQLMPLF